MYNQSLIIKTSKCGPVTKTPYVCTVRFILLILIFKRFVRRTCNSLSCTSKSPSLCPPSNGQPNYAIRSTSSYLSLLLSLLQKLSRFDLPCEVFPVSITHMDHNHHSALPTTPAIRNPDTVRKNQCCPIQKMVCASFPCQLLPLEITKKLHEFPLYSAGISTLTASSGSWCSHIYCFHMTDKNNGPVLPMTLMYGNTQLRL
jgi:hypothetical protein